MSILKLRIVALQITLLLAASFAGPASAKTYAYVGNAGSNEISVFVIDLKNGDLAPVETVPFPGVEKPGSSTPLTVSPDHRYLFAGVRSEPYVAVAFAIDRKTGKLKHLGNARWRIAWPISRPIAPADSCSAPPMAATRSRSIRSELTASSNLPRK